MSVKIAFLTILFFSLSFSSALYYTVVGYYDAVKNNDLAKHMAFYDQQAFSNLSAIQYEKAQLWNRAPLVRVSLSNLSMNVSGDVANVSYYVVYLRNDSGTLLNLSGEYKMVLIRHTNGEWKIVKLEKLWPVEKTQLSNETLNETLNQSDNHENNPINETEQKPLPKTQPPSKNAPPKKPSQACFLTSILAAFGLASVKV